MATAATESADSRASQRAGRKTESPTMPASVLERSQLADALSVAVLTPTGQDGRVAQKVLQRTGLDPRVCTSMADVCTLIEQERIGVLLLAEEALDEASREKLFDTLNRQPSWSDLPIVILTGEDELSGALPRAEGSRREGECHYAGTARSSDDADNGHSVGTPCPTKAA